MKVAKNLLIDGLYHLSRLFLGALFLFSSLSKIAAFDGFKTEVASYHIVNYHVVSEFALLVVVAELLFALLLIINMYVKEASAGIVALLILFTAAIMYAVLTHQPVGNCGCFGNALKESLSWTAALRDILFMIPAFFVLFITTKNRSFRNFLTTLKPNNT